MRNRTWASFVCGGIFTPGQTKARARIVLSDLQTLASDIAKSTVDESFKQAFADYFRVAQVTLNNIIGEVFIGADDFIAEQVKRMQEFRENFKSNGGNPSAPQHIPDKPPPTSLIEKTVIFGGIIGILWAASKLVLTSTGYRKAAPKTLPQRSK